MVEVMKKKKKIMDNMGSKNVSQISMSADI